VRIEGAGRLSGLARDRVDAGGGNTLLAKQLSGGVDQRGARLVLVFRGHSHGQTFR
jgi:hypothetical protein